MTRQRLPVRIDNRSLKAVIHLPIKHLTIASHYQWRGGLSGEQGTV